MVVIPYTDEIEKCCMKAINELTEIYGGYTLIDRQSILGEKLKFKYQIQSMRDGSLSLVFDNDTDASMFLLRYS